MGKYTINFTADDKIMLMRKQFLQAYLDKHLDDNPAIKTKLETGFQQIIKELDLQCS